MADTQRSRLFARQFAFFSISSLFSLSMSARPCYNPIEIQSSRRAVSCGEKQGAHPEESSHGH
ncbi:MAG: hypothetical protein ABR912_12125, partial [Terracidiphilus sp.]